MRITFECTVEPGCTPAALNAALESYGLDIPRCHRLGAAGHDWRHARQQFERHPCASLRIDARQCRLGGRLPRRWPARALQRGFGGGRNASAPRPRQAAGPAAIRRAARKGDRHAMAPAGAGNARARRLRPADAAGEFCRTRTWRACSPAPKERSPSPPRSSSSSPGKPPTGRSAFAASTICPQPSASFPRSWC